MAKRKTQQIKSPRIQYRVTHPLYGSDNIFDSWMTLCEVTMDIAEDEAKNRLNDMIVAMITNIADEMIATAEEYEPEAVN